MGASGSFLYEDENFVLRYSNLSMTEQRIFDEQYKIVREYFNKLTSAEMESHGHRLWGVKYMKDFLDKNYDHQKFEYGPPKEDYLTSQYEAQAVLRNFAWKRLEIIKPAVAHFIERPEVMSRGLYLLNHTVHDFQKNYEYTYAIQRYRLDEFTK